MLSLENNENTHVIVKKTISVMTMSINKSCYLNLCTELVIASILECPILVISTM